MSPWDTRVLQGWGVTLPPFPSSWMGTWGCRGAQVGLGLPSPALLPPLAMVTPLPGAQTQASALCCIGPSLWAKSISKHKLSGGEGKKNSRNTCGFLGGWGAR